MKNIAIIYILLILFSSLGVNAQSQTKRKPVNYTVILDLSDRILSEHQLEKDQAQIEQLFKKFESKARRGLILTSKDRFSVKLVPQKNSPLDINYFENKLQLKLNEVSIKDKNNKMVEFSNSITKTLAELSTKAKYSETSSGYFGVDLWAYLNNYGQSLQLEGYDNTVLIITDGYFDFENRGHVLKQKKRYTSTQFLNKITGVDWKQKAESGEYGLFPIQLPAKINWIISGISSKNDLDVLQTKKLVYFWDKWLKESGAVNYEFILDGSESQMSSKLINML